MPLAFPSLNHGTIAFGFFNVDTDLLLLEHYFLFANDFCSYIATLASRSEQSAFETSWAVHSIDRRSDIGDLMAAINGIAFSGFIGDLYRRFPFPGNPEGFKQKPEGFQNRAVVEEMLGHRAVKREIFIRCDADHETVALGEYLFSKAVFHDLIGYVWLGGYPRWRENVRPEYVLEMKKEIEKYPHWLMAGLTL